ncbi:MAG: MipA/OmpV family protein [Paracoccus sp. (in: a-proteobacteria)]|uniref:MipA/OmpV family protein n=1 Tax=Paracoccus sp. TaxID=267 RepID=UPI0039E64D34
MTRALAIALLSVSVLAAPAAAQSLRGMDQFSFDAGLGLTYGPDYMGAGDDGASPWIILRNPRLGGEQGQKQGLAITPSVNFIGKRDAGDSDSLSGMDDIGVTGELGLRLSYVSGPVTSYGAMRKGFGGHSGLVGEIGTKYRYDASDKLSLWTGVELELGDDEFTGTYFGVTDAESLASGHAAYDPDGGAYQAKLSLEARYMLTPDTSLIGRVTYGHLLGDAADSPLVQDKGAPSISLGIARRLNFRF